MWTAISRSPASRYFSRHSATRGRFSLHIPQLRDQKWINREWPSASCRTCSAEPLSHSVAPSSEGAGVPILIGIVVSPKFLLVGEWGERENKNQISFPCPSPHPFRPKDQRGVNEMSRP